MNEALGYILSFGFFHTILRVTTPILLTSLGSVVAERAGTPNIALEAIMLFSALLGALGTGLLGSLWLGFLFAILGGLFIAAMLAFFALRLKADIILSGIALNLLAGGGTVFIMYSIIGDKGSTSGLATLTFPNLHIPLLKDIPVLGPLLSGHNVFTYLAFLLVFVVWLYLYRTKGGLRLRAVGEHAEAAASVGIRVTSTQVKALMLSGLLAGLGGAFMSMGYMNGFSQNMVAGRGFIALAAASMGQLHPVLTMVAALVFGTADALSNVLASMRIPDEFVKMIPYLTTVIGLVIFSIRDKRKKAARRKGKGQPAKPGPATPTAAAAREDI